LLDLARVRRFYFDKTGTLEAVESQFEPDAGAGAGAGAEAGEVIPYLRELALKSRHPVLRGLNFGAAGGPELLREVHEEPGQGVSAVTASGDRLLVGRPAYLRGHGVAVGESGDSPAVALNGRPVGRIVIKSAYDLRAREFLRRLLRRLGPGRGVTILSGDPVSGAGDALTAVDKGIVYRGGLSPEDKARALEPRSAFVGDGLNDTLALAEADVGFRVGPRISGFAPVDFQLQTPDLNLILTVLRYARKYRRVLVQTAVAALLYNVVALTLAANGRFTPLGAVLAMFFSFSILLLSSLRLLRVPKEIA
jgi:Cu2+-exporting ATPase/Cu+-exporting ATPase